MPRAQGIPSPWCRRTSWTGASRTRRTPSGGPDIAPIPASRAPCRPCDGYLGHRRRWKVSTVYPQRSGLGGELFYFCLPALAHELSYSKFGRLRDTNQHCRRHTILSKWQLSFCCCYPACWMLQQLGAVGISDVYEPISSLAKTYIFLLENHVPKFHLNPLCCGGSLPFSWSDLSLFIDQFRLFILFGLTLLWDHPFFADETPEIQVYDNLWSSHQILNTFP